MSDVVNRMSQASASPSEMMGSSRFSEKQKHSEGWLARTLEDQTARLPSDVWLWAAFGSIGGSLVLQCLGKKHDALFVGQWAPTFLLIGLYNKLVKVAGSDRMTNQA